MYDQTPAFVSGHLDAIFGKHNWKVVLVRIRNELENLGFDYFSDCAWTVEYSELDDQETIKAVADNLYIISETPH